MRRSYDLQGLRFGQVRKLKRAMERPDVDEIIDSWRFHLAGMLHEVERNLRESLYQALHPDRHTYPVPTDDEPWEWFAPPTPTPPPYDGGTSPWPNGPLVTEGKDDPDVKGSDLEPENLAYAVSNLEIASRHLEVYKQLVEQYVALGDWRRDFRGRSITHRLSLSDLATAVGLKTPQSAESRLKRRWAAASEALAVSRELSSGWFPLAAESEGVTNLAARPWGKNVNLGTEERYERVREARALRSKRKPAPPRRRSVTYSEIDDALEQDGIDAHSEALVLAAAYKCKPSLATVAANAAKRAALTPGRSTLYLLGELVELCGANGRIRSTSVPEHISAMVVSRLYASEPPSLEGLWSMEEHVDSILAELGLPQESKTRNSSIAAAVEPFIREILLHLERSWDADAPTED